MRAKRDEFFCREIDVFSDLPNRDRRDVPSAMIWNGRAATIRMAKLFVRTALAFFHEPEGRKHGNHFART